MSHYSVAVFLYNGNSLTETVDRLLAPYDEALPVKKELSKTKAEIIQSQREILRRDYKEEYSAWRKNPKVYEAEHPNPHHLGYIKSLPQRLKRSDEELYESYLGDDKKRLLSEGLLNEAGDLYETFNPDAKWDWYQIGGRWQGSLILKQGKTGFKGTPSLLTEPSEHYDGAYVRDIDFERMREWKRKTLTPYKEIQKDPFWTEERIDATYRNEDEYIRRCTTFHTYAVVTPDGEWHAVGEMGWFGFSSESPAVRRKWEQEYHKRFLEPAQENDWYMVIVDCHI